MMALNAMLLTMERLGLCCESDKIAEDAERPELKELGILVVFRPWPALFHGSVSTWQLLLFTVSLLPKKLNPLSLADMSFRLWKAQRR